MIFSIRGRARWEPVFHRLIDIEKLRERYDEKKEHKSCPLHKNIGG
jgi:hypothetical protein